MMTKLDNAELPKGWIKLSIEDIAEVKGGKRLPKGEKFAQEKTNYPYIRVTDFSNESVDVTKIQYIDEDIQQNISNYIISVDDLYISIAGTIGLVGTIPQELDGANLTENAAKITSIYEVEKKYLLYVLNTPEVKSLFSIATTSSGQPKLALKRIRTVIFPMAPLPEQKRIVEKLDSLSAQVDTIQQRLNNLPNIIKRFRQSVLAAAVSGKLTKQWRIENKIGEWAEVVLGDVIHIGPKKPKLLDEDLVSFSPMAMMPKLMGEELISEVKEWKQVKKGFTCFKNDDVLLAKITPCFENEKSVIAKGLKNGIGTGSTEFMVLRPNGKMLSYLIFCHVKSLSFLKDGEMNMSGSVGHRRVPKEFVENWTIGLPLIEEQTEIVRLVEQYFALADTLEKNLANAKQRVDNLTQSILAKAFKGELVPQDPSDESADKLLERIKAARIDAEKLEKAAKKAAKVKPKSKVKSKVNAKVKGVA
jgi:type I restriction enzyme S subunit